MIPQEKMINTIRTLSIDAIQKANSGHPGLPMGAAPMAYTLWAKHLKGSALEPNWKDRDRFILSAGHGSMLYYALLHLFGYEVSIEDIKNFRQYQSITPGHPEYGMTPGVESTTGPLGQGLSMAVGMAIAEARLAAKFNSDDIAIVDHYTYALAGDGCLMEGITSEASSLAGHLKLGKLIVLYDDNDITIDGSTDITFTEDVEARYRAYGWQVLNVADGNDTAAIDKAITDAKANADQPSLIVVKTVIGYGSPNKSGSSAVHGAPLGEEEVKLTKLAYGMDPEKSFYVEPEVYDAMKVIIDERELERFSWEQKLTDYREKYPEKYQMWLNWHNSAIDEAAFCRAAIWDGLQSDQATRAAGGVFMNAISDLVPNLMGGSADLNGSTKTYLKGLGDFTAENRDGNNILFGVREHAMAAILNGMALHGGIRPYGATFLVFSDYLKPAVRLSALMKLPVIYVFTHDSIGVGEDGPTHQPIEHFFMLRSIPGVTVYRPADANETGYAWLEALKKTDGPSVIILSRQTLPKLPGVNPAAAKGGYVISPEKGEKPEGILIGTGSEVHVLVEAQRLLSLDGIDVRVVSMPSIEKFESQDKDYIESILPSDVRKRIVMEAGITLPWRYYATDSGKVIGMDRFGESAPGGELFKTFGFTAERVASEYKSL
ncbi:MAG: transketolase [Clostridiales bacterium]|nr:MAG: transketolase [Clostridiales bacterium]